MKRYRLILTAFFLLAGVSTSQAQFSQSPDDEGAADTVAMVFSVIPDATTNALKFQMDLYLFSDSNRYLGGASGYSWSNPNMTMDSARANTAVTSGWDGGVFLLDGSSLVTTNANRRFQFGGFSISGPGILPSPTRKRLASYYFTLSSWSTSDSVCIDTLAFSAGTFYEWIEEDGMINIPFFTGRACAFDTASPSNIVLSADSLHFSGVSGGANPAAQTFQINTDNANFPFTLTETISWLVVSPILGTTPRTITCTPNITALPAGNYKDSILVAAAAADNSPQYVVVTLTLAPPPPLISATPGSFTFNAIANGANPANKTLTIKNIGGSVLNWTVTKTQAWLGLSPTSGVDSNQVTVSADIMGLVAGTYLDTITVSDPAAGNNPIKVPVTLNVGSDLPSIVATPQVTYRVVDDDSTTIPPAMFTITNGGVGPLTFSLTKTSPRILTMTPDTGSAPNTVTVTFKLIAGSPGNTYYDTIWVTSPEATNSPYPVVMILHYVTFPAQLSTSLDTINFTVYECSQGAGNALPFEFFSVLNVGLDFPQFFTLEYESDLFTTDITSGELPSFVGVQALDPGLPLGVYYDTLLVVAPFAFGSPKSVIVKYTKSAGVIQPQIVLTSTNITLPTQENEGPIFAATLGIQNRYGGCMEWDLVESIPWISSGIYSGDVPGNTGILFEALPPYPFGTYTDSFYVTAPTASNDSVEVKVTMIVWKFRGDVNYSKSLTVLDLTYYVNFLFNGGPFPVPELRVGDVNCDRLVTVLDIVYMVNYLFNQGPIPCGNPFKKAPIDMPVSKEAPAAPALVVPSNSSAN